MAQNVMTFDEQQILPKGTELTDKLITKLAIYGILTVYVEDVIPDLSKLPAAPKEPSYSSRLKKDPSFRKFKQDYELNIDAFRCAINKVAERHVKLDINELLRQSLRIAAIGENTIGIISMLQNMREYDDSTYAHCINVALLCNVLANWLKLGKQQVELATTCGLLHDLGKLLVPHDIIAKPSGLTADEYSLVQQHPLSGYQLLHEQHANPRICNAALMHHERSDGSGYPMHLKGNEIDMYARIVAITDVYDAMTSARVYRGPTCPFRVIEIFEAEGFQKYDTEYLLVFLENVVNTYIQNRCRLSDGREGDIIYINKFKLSRPVVQCGTEYINLAEEPDLYIENLL